MRSRTTHENPGGDSFLDIIANMVGIVIILVMVVGLRIKNAPIAEALPPVQENTEALERQRDEANIARVSIETELKRKAVELKKMQLTLAIQSESRDKLLTAISVVEHKMDELKQSLSVEDRKTMDLAELIRQADRQRWQLHDELQTLERTKPRKRIVKNHPTPISHVVDRDEIAFQLRHGRIAFVPKDQLTDAMYEHVKKRLDVLQRQSELTGMIGPIGGFELKYTIDRVTISADQAMSSGEGMIGSRPQLRNLVFIPVSEELGEPVRLALERDSLFLQTIARAKPGRETVTIWTYPNSFDEFLTVKNALQERGFDVAARPLPEGIRIGASRYGSKSTAQ